MWHARIITTKTTKKMKTTNDDCVGIRGNDKIFGRGEMHESKQRHLDIYQRAAPSFRIVNATSTETSLVPGIDQLHSTNS